MRQHSGRERSYTAMPFDWQRSRKWKSVRNFPVPERKRGVPRAVARVARSDGRRGRDERWFPPSAGREEARKASNTRGPMGVPKARERCEPRGHRSHRSQSLLSQTRRTRPAELRGVHPHDVKTRKEQGPRKHGRREDPFPEPIWMLPSRSRVSPHRTV